MLNPVSSSSQVYAADAYTTQATAKSSQTVEQTPILQDNVQLSPQAKAAVSGDVDHDGDSH